MPLKKETVSFVSLSDVLDYMGYPHLYDYAPEIFSGVTWGDSVYTICGLEYVIRELKKWVDFVTPGYHTQEVESFRKNSKKLLDNHTFVDMES